MFFALCYQNKCGETMPISTLATLNSAQSINLRSKIQLSQDANSFENELAKGARVRKKDFRLV